MSCSTKKILDKMQLEGNFRRQGKYYGLVVHSTNNIGDNIQSLASLQFLPHVNFLINRDYISKYKLPEKTKIILNGWYTLEPLNWPPRKGIIPLFISFHLSPNVARAFLTPNMIAYLKEYSPIGCRDMSTQDILEEKGIDTYLSGCLTLTLSHGYAYLKTEGKKYLIIDVDQRVLNVLPNEIKNDSVILSQKDPSHQQNKLSFFSKIFPKNLRKGIPESLKTRVYRFLDHPFVKNDEWYLKKIEIAYRRLEEIASAKIVITSKIHVALPAVSFGKPVIFVNENLEDPRFPGLIDLMNAYSTSEFIEQVRQIDWDNLQNPNVERLNTLKSELIRRCQEFINS